MRSGVAMSHNRMINHSNPYFEDCAAASNLHAIVRFAVALESGGSGGSRDDIRNLEENTIGHAGSAKIPHSISILHCIEYMSIKTLEIRFWSSLKPLKVPRN